MRRELRQRRGDAVASNFYCAVEKDSQLTQQQIVEYVVIAFLLSLGNDSRLFQEILLNNCSMNTPILSVIDLEKNSKNRREKYGKNQFPMRF